MTAETPRPGSRRLLIAGGGLPSLALALALKQAHGPALAVTVIDPGRADPGRHRGRAYALAAGGRRMLDRLGLWPRVAEAAEPITEMVISDSRLADPVRPVFLTFGREAEDDRDPGEPFAHMIEAEPLAEALAEACRGAGVSIVAAGVMRAVPEGAAIGAVLTTGETLRGDLLVAADGARSRLREAARIGWVGWSYPQVGIVATIGHARPHGGRAVEHFLPAGPFAILPLRDGGPLGHRSSIVWTERSDDAEALLSGGPDEVLAEIERRFTLDLGTLALEHGPSRHPLAFGIARAFRAERVALLGDAAHVIHPIAGQGLNLGLADAAALAEAVTEALRLGLDPGGPDVLRAYERARRFDSFAMAAATDGLNRLFSNDALPLRLARDLGLGIVDRLPGLKRFFIGEAAAARGSRPRLLRGEAL
ncbi:MULTISPECIES: FAD-dependent monooxygenase [unclassified Methylobacterium]|uniref:FAD-dependent monooxygenase n=1 Tax=unclassified Methylobacterium TaxID=2615210 RepID=UPI0005BC7D0D|nr:MULTISPECIES: FAD-dependent monooxygenase [unclassified Methylobacterium]KOX58395.1 2-octaprenyl-6-methoxyphenyl hydroxylase [Streptomyces purpurogeneiscleroticus]SFU62678.1 2-octaprenyl-6-methoxyphenol hydroxylase [Methylobacterium sp. UNCCL125]